jgi:hypothetical protein
MPEYLELHTPFYTRLFLQCTGAVTLSNAITMRKWLPPRHLALRRTKAPTPEARQGQYPRTLTHRANVRATQKVACHHYEPREELIFVDAASWMVVPTANCFDSDPAPERGTL